jgi:hypothetical protein
VAEESAGGSRLYMVIERFRPGVSEAVYARFRSQGRMLPDGLVYIESWVTDDRQLCYQLMRSSRAELFDEWISHWDDLVDFEVIPVMTSAEAAAQ